MENNYYNKIFRTKTEKAIQMVNFYENHHSQLARISLLYGYNHSQLLPTKLYKELDHSKWKKLQFIDNQCKLYKLSISHLKQDLSYTLKLVFKDFSGSQINFSLSSRPQPIQLEQCQHKVKSQKIIKITQIHNHHRGLFITFHSLEMTFFKFRYEFQLEEKNDFKLERTQSESRIKANLPSISSQTMQTTQFITTSLKTQRSISSSRMLNRQKSPKTIKRQELISARLKSIETEKLRMNHAKQKKHDLSIYKQKYQELKIVANKCKGLLQQFEAIHNEQLKKQSQNVQLLAKIVYLANFIQVCHVKAEAQSEKMQNAVRFRKNIMKAAHKFMKIHREIRRMIPNPKDQQLISVKHLATQQAVLLHNLSFKRSGEILIDCLSRVSPCIIVNKLLQRATEYRVKVRTIQKYWLLRNKSQLMCFQDYINYQLLDILKKNPNFELFNKAFYSQQTQKQLSWQYLTQESQKLKPIFYSYHARLQEISEMKNANIEIAEFNKKALKKNQKNYLNIPNVPPKPIGRYFRDIQILKSMVRTWFEIQYRKYIRKNCNNKSTRKSLKKL